MIRFSANTGFLWPDHPFLDRIRAARDAGFDAVEFHDEAQGVDLQALRDTLEETGLPVLGLNVAMGPSAGCAAIPGEEARALREVEAALDLADRIGSGAVHVLAGRCEKPDFNQYYKVLSHAAKRSPDRTILIEPICRAAMPDYALPTLDAGLQAIEKVGAPNLKIMFDFYHIETAHGDAAALFQRHLDQIGHVQIASVPERARPGTATLAFVKDCARAGWATPFGCEYRPGPDEVIAPPAL